MFVLFTIVVCIMLLASVIGNAYLLYHNMYLRGRVAGNESVQGYRHRGRRS